MQNRLVPKKIQITAEDNTATNSDNLAIIKRYFKDVKITENNAHIFTMFGYKDPRFYINLSIKNKQILSR